MDYMKLTILRCLQNANYSMKCGLPFTEAIAKTQLNNAVTLLEKGYALSDEIQPLLEQYGSVEAVPHKS